MDEPHSTHGCNENCIQNFSQNKNLKGRAHLIDQEREVEQDIKMCLK
jgi:hypothetical protein